MSDDSKSFKINNLSNIHRKTVSLDLNHVLHKN